MTPEPESPEFLTTRWSLVRAAGTAQDARSRRALAELCALYWYPAYAFARRKGLSADDAADGTQSFFALLIERGDLGAVEQGRGHFRSWLRTALAHFLQNERARTEAQKRGGGRPLFSIDREGAERRVDGLAAAGDDPEQAFERAWATTLLERVGDALREEYEARGRGRVFAALLPTLTDPGAAGPLRELAARLDSTEPAIKMAAHRLRQRFRERLRREVAETVGDAGDVEDEVAELSRALAPRADRGS